MSPWIEPLFSPRPAWTAGDGWFAFGRGDDSTLTVKSMRGAGLIVVRWPLASMSVTDEDRLARARWSGEYTLRANPSAQAAVAAMSERQLEQQYRLHAGRLPFSERAPEVMAAWGVDECLMLSGFAPRDYADATSLTVVALNVREHRLVGLLRLNGTDRRIRHLSADGIFATYRDQDGAFVVEPYAFPFVRQCGVGR